VRFARSVDRRGRVVGGPSAVPPAAAIASLPWSPRRVIWHG
jgi:hypothetical protein